MYRAIGYFSSKRQVLIVEYRSQISIETQFKIQCNKRNNITPHRPRGKQCLILFAECKCQLLEKTSTDLKHSVNKQLNKCYSLLHDFAVSLYINKPIACHSDLLFLGYSKTVYFVLHIRDTGNKKVHIWEWIISRYNFGWNIHEMKAREVCLFPIWFNYQAYVADEI